jgi:hypothetical protein
VKYKEAYQRIEDNCKEGDVIFGQFLRMFYLSDCSRSLYRVDMLRSQRYSLEQFREDIEEYDQGWIVWRSDKSDHLNPELIEYIDSNYIKVGGESIDDTHVELYRFEK